MGRRGSSSRSGSPGMFTSNRKSSSSKTSSSPSSAPAKTSPSTTTPAAAQKPATTPTPAAAPAAPATGMPPQRSMMSEIGSNIIGTAGGVVLGHAIMGMFRGSENMTPAQQEQLMEKKSSGPCATQFKSLMRCLENNKEETGACNFSFSEFKSCEEDNNDLD